jgi:hypothetical protein
MSSVRRRFWKASRNTRPTKVAHTALKGATDDLLDQRQ